MILFDKPYLENKILELEKEQNEENFWNNNQKALEIIEEYNQAKEILDTYLKINKEHQEISELLFATSDNDLDMKNLLDEMISSLTKEASTFRRKLLFTEEYDDYNVILEIHPGAGGVESHDWANMLYRMYVRYAERNKFKMRLLDILEGEEAGIKSVTMEIKGKNIYGLLKSEKGVHRLVRISPFDANKRRHTSFASVNITPIFKNEIKIDIAEKDLRIDTFRSSGAGGQNVNKVESAVRITHIPTGIVTSCQIERSQSLNKDTAMKMLQGKLLQLEKEKKDKEIAGIVGEQKENEWGSQIRSYVFCPYTMVKDNRTNYSTSDVEGVMDGNIDEFIYAYLDMLSRNRELK